MGSGPAPFKVVALEPGMADLVDRQSGDKVGYLLLAGGSAGKRWDGYLPFDPSASLQPRRVAIELRRADAARSLWLAAGRELP